MTKAKRQRRATVRAVARAIALLATPPGRRPDEQQPLTMMKDNSADAADAKLGMAWWNALTERERARWSKEAGNTGRAVDAWTAFKKQPVIPRKKEESLPAVSRASHMSG